MSVDGTTEMLYAGGGLARRRALLVSKRLLLGSGGCYVVWGAEMG